MKFFSSRSWCLVHLKSVGIGALPVFFRLLLRLRDYARGRPGTMYNISCYEIFPGPSPLVLG
jgi:hypothetical protein